MPEACQKHLQPLRFLESFSRTNLNSMVSFQTRQKPAGENLAQQETFLLPSKQLSV